MLAGALEIQLSAGIARLQKDMQDTKRIVSSAMGEVSTMAGRANAALGALGAGLSVAGLVALSKHAIDSIDKLNDLSKSTNLAVEQLAGLGYAARVSGGSLEGAAASINKLSQNIGKDAAKYRELGITAKEPLEAFKQLADIFVAVEDPQLRAAFAAEALGKGWAAAAPLLAEGGQRIGELVEKGTQVSGVTAEMARQADEFNDRLAELAGTGAVMNQVLGPMLPLLIRAADDLITLRGEAMQTGVGFSPLTEALRAFIIVAGNVGFVVRGIAVELGGMAAQVAAMLSGDFGRVATIGEMMKVDAIKRRQAFDEWEQQILAVGTASVAAVPALKALTAGANDKAKAFLDAGAAAKKAAAEIEAYNKRAREIGLRGEEEALKAEHEMLEEEMQRRYMLRKKDYEAAEELRQIELDGQEALAKKVVGIVEEESRQIEELRRANFVAFWNEAGDLAGNFFSDLVTNGASAFDNLKRHLKDLLGEMVALFAKRWVLNLAAGGSLLGSATDALAGGGGGLAGGLLGNLFGSPLGMVTGGLGIAAALYSAFNDGPENRNFQWSQGAGGPGRFGGIGSAGNYDFAGTALLAAVDSLDRRFEALMGPGGSSRATSSLAGYTAAGRRMDGQPAQFAFPEGTDREAAEQLAKELLQSRYGTLFAEVDAELADQVRNWSGDSTSLQAFIEGMIGVVEGLGQLNIMGLNVDSLQAMQREGEGLDQTFQRVANTWAWFTENFYTDAEKLEIAQAQVNETFAALGMAVPATITDFRKLVESLDLASAADRALYERLMELAPAFLDVSNAAGDTTAAVEEMAGAVRDFGVATDFAARAEERRRRQIEIDARKALQGYLGGLLLDEGASPLTMDQRLAEARSQFESTLGLARGGDLGAMQGLGGAFDAYLQIARQMYGSSAQYNAIFQSGFDEVRGVAGGGPTWQSAMASALPASGGKLATTEDINKLITMISRGIRVSDPETRDALEDVKTELRSNKGALA